MNISYRNEGLNKKTETNVNSTSSQRFSIETDSGVFEFLMPDLVETVQKIIINGLNAYLSRQFRKF